MELAIMGALFVCALQDIKNKEITRRCLVMTAVVTLLALIVQHQGDWGQMILGAGIGLGVLLLVKLTGEIGAADGILLICTGVFWGWRKNLALLFLALLLTAAVALFLLFVLKKDRKYEVPFVPFLCIAFALVQWG